ncbi:glycine/D-amino acid oxidase-like deaminating enzyme [Dongia mobilis]|uniref:Glycine/D-amino acid oxidase-like deaminating enzyme n=1 Tax=Dongia mobilis TaxID=578943 RepID=A0A4R6WTZ1_9PROT|nr:FAD-binding oxidoreductase [Dongia mobilis]TDQ83839.1 glycine/D-amino acid oxidase-like deaminating enzyme [Dongia mobilis]
MTGSGLPRSLWAATACAAPPYAEIRNRLPAGSPTSADVVVIGGGYTGLSTALHLALAGRSVILAEAAEPGWGASGRNGGQVIAGLKTPLRELAAIFGDDRACAITVNMGGSADLVFALIERYRMDCQAGRGGWLQAAHGPKPYRDIVLPRYEQWRGLGVAARLLDRDQMAAAIGSSAPAYHGAWHDPRGGVLQPLSYARELARAAIAEGAVIHAQMPVRALRRQGETWQVTTDAGVLRANQVVLATNAYGGVGRAELWPGLARAVIPVTSFQMATQPLPAAFDHILPAGMGVTDSRRLLLYFRRDHTGRLVMGGRSPVEDDPALADALPLQRAIRRLFPELGLPSPEFVWSGKVAITRDRLPHIHMPAEGLWVFQGCNGRGVAMCTMMGRMLADLAAGMAPGEVPFPVTAPDAFPLHGLRRLGVFALSQYYRLLDRLESWGST